MLHWLGIYGVSTTAALLDYGFDWSFAFDVVAVLYLLAASCFLQFGDVVQIFPNTESVIRLVGALLVEVNDEMISSDRRYIAAGSVAALADPEEEPLTSLPAAPRT